MTPASIRNAGQFFDAQYLKVICTFGADDFAAPFQPFRLSRCSSLCSHVGRAMLSSLAATASGLGRRRDALEECGPVAWTRPAFTKLSIEFAGEAGR